jgi:hypothetical protein
MMSILGGMDLAKSCWKHAEILYILFKDLSWSLSVTFGHANIDESKALLLEFSGSSVHEKNLVNHVTEQWTAVIEKAYNRCKSTAIVVSL